jgi:hypothetical protein
MTEDSINLALIAKEKKDQEFYQGHLSSYEDINLEVHPSLMELRNKSHGKLYAGFLVDIRTLIKSTGGEKLFFSHLLQFFPVMRMTKRPGSESFSGLIESKDLGRLKGSALLDAFVNDLCRKNPQREIPSGRQQGIFRSVLAYYSNNFTREKPEKAVIENLTTKSCFLVTNDEISKGANIWLVFTDMKDQTPMGCEVKWTKKWRPGSLYLPGLGLTFIAMTDAQVGELAKMTKT